VCFTNSLPHQPCLTQSIANRPTSQQNNNIRAKATANTIKVTSPAVALTSIQSDVANENKQESFTSMFYYFWFYEILTGNGNTLKPQELRKKILHRVH
jgi:hypothetical protein